MYAHAEVRAQLLVVKSWDPGIKLRSVSPEQETYSPVEKSSCSKLRKVCLIKVERERESAGASTLQRRYWVIRREISSLSFLDFFPLKLNNIKKRKPTGKYRKAPTKELLFWSRLWLKKKKRSRKQCIFVPLLGMCSPWETVEMQEGGSSHLVVSCWWSNALSFKLISHAALQSPVTKKPAPYIYDYCFLRTWHSARHSGGLMPTSQHHWIGDMNFGRHKQNFSLSFSPPLLCYEKASITTATQVSWVLSGGPPHI